MTEILFPALRKGNDKRKHMIDIEKSLLNLSAKSK